MKKYLFFALLSLFSCNELKKTKLSGFVFGTSYSIQFYTSSNSNYSNEIINIFNDIDISMSTYNKKSIISKVNNNQNVILDSHFQNVFHSSKKIYELTDGRFDPSIGLFVNYWGFGPEKFMIDPEIKKGDPLSYLFSKTGMDKFKIIDDKLIRPNDSYIDFNAIAKGYAVDVIGQFLKDKQIDNYLIEIGGEITTLGANINKNKPWIVAIDMPRFDGDRSNYSSLELNDISLASSGTYRKFKIDSMGNRYAHIINPLTGHPTKTKILSVTVKASTCIEADAYATAIHTMKISDIEEFFKINKEISSLIIFENNKNELEELILNNFYN
ncbi:MAG: thiamine biosynthesis protein [Flavobacteriaceae bacterium]|nr:thiamine biosynthesis protein [Flavobacteriaceae bacterium]|tara:strand:- start:9415 stop:10395 length:981 start_codon:yes stop_codon:yes gene_type:complete